MSVQTLSRRRFIIAAALLLGGTAFFAFVRTQDEPPPASWVRDELWGDHLLAYVVWDGVPSAVLSGEVGRDDRMNYDRMIRGDWFWPTWPPRPQWQLMGLGYSIARSDAPATVGYAPCVGILGERCRQPPELFGQINDPSIVAMEVQIGDAWRRFAVAAPGFAVRLEGVTGEPSGYRWLDPEGHVVWEMPVASPTKPGARDARRRGPRRHPTPSPLRAGTPSRH